MPVKTVPKGTEDSPIVVKPEPFEKPEVKITWTAPARLFIKRNPVWFVGLIVLAVAVVVVLALMKQWTFAIATAAFAFVLFSINTVEPGTQTFSITSYGIKMGQKHVKYNVLKWFWFGEHEGHSALYISTYLNMPHVFELPLPDENTKELKEKIQTELLKNIPYHEEGARDWLNSIDNIIYRIEPYLPKFLVNWYSQKFHNA